MQSNKLYVGNILYETTEEEIRELFSNYGTVEDVKIIEGKGFGFVEMSSQEETDNVKERLDGYDFKGRSLRVAEARPQRDKGDRRGGGGGGYNKGPGRGPGRGGPGGGRGRGGFGDRGDRGGGRKPY